MERTAVSHVGKSIVKLPQDIGCINGITDVNAPPAVKTVKPQM